MNNPVIIGDATLYLGNCLEILPHLQRAGCVDAIVSDPPYGIGFQHGGYGKTVRKIADALTNLKPIIGDDAPFDPVPWLDLSAATNSRGVAVLLWGASHFKTRLPDGGTFLCWDKSCGQGAADSFVDAEFAWMNRKNARCIYRHFWKGAMRSGKDNSAASSRSHPSQKPVELMRWCLETRGLA